MTLKTVAGLATFLLAASILAPAPALSGVQRTVLVEETGWAT